jgi:hypothetical protein
MDTIPFDPREYSMLKFGSDAVARKFGYGLADSFFEAHADELIISRAIVIPSPYNYVPNAATIMTTHFVNRLNHLLVDAQGEHVDYATIPRKVSYINDYGFLSAEKRKSLISGDKFFMNSKYVKGKTLIFIDDVKITGTHEDKLVEIMNKDRLKNRSFFLYFARYEGDDPAIESRLNLAGISNLEEYTQLSHEDGHHLIVRPIKFLLSQDPDQFKNYLKFQSKRFAEKLYHACLGEGYYRIPSYQENFNVIRDTVIGNGAITNRVNNLMLVAGGNASE